MGSKNCLKSKIPVYHTHLNGLDTICKTFVIVEG